MDIISQKVDQYIFVIYLPSVPWIYDKVSYDCSKVHLEIVLEMTHPPNLIALILTLAIYPHQLLGSYWENHDFNLE